MLLLLMSCGINTPGSSLFEKRIEYRPVVVDTGCKWNNIITVSDDDVFTPVTARQILIHNQTYEKNCPEEVQP